MLIRDNMRHMADENPEPESETVFVVMQVGPKDSAERKRADEIYDYVVKPELERRGLAAYRADLDPSPGAITPKLLKELVDAKVVIADLTGRNPNVFYELGVAHSFTKSLISIADSVKSLPFDAKDERVIELGEYPESGLAYAQGETAKQRLRESLDVVLAEGYVPPSPLREVAGTQSLDDLAPENPVAAELAQMREVLEFVRIQVSRQGGTAGANSKADFQALRVFIETQVEEGNIGPEEVPAMANEHTSTALDAWVEKLSEIGWSKRTASSDEPPF